MSRKSDPPPSVGVFYLARGADNDAMQKFTSFRDSYQRYCPGAEHSLCVIFKGFDNSVELQASQDALAGLNYTSFYVDDDRYDVGAYFAVASRSSFDLVCFLNTSCRILGGDWLLKLAANAARADVGVVSCTGSYEAPQHPDVRVNAVFPNPHVRTNAFLLRRQTFLAMAPRVPLTSKLNAHLFEHGVSGMTRQVADQGRKALVVGRDGRGYEPAEWPRSETFRRGGQSNLLIADNRTTEYEQAPLAEKRALFHLAWGDGSLGRVEVEPARPDHSNAAFLRQAYRELLGREAEAAGLANWLGMMSTGYSRDAVVEMILQSDEAQLRHAGDPLIQQLFEASIARHRAGA